ncbi:ATP-binding protein [Patescibacteria group bacterium]|nr:ATP-binding protein [Patescibacteria group bacterium]MBU4056516.1 ATP-binding protein [Patescibacteria group bacterium]MBU4368926.1 ATP-binding protein [Patescibacteria group bacterium]
MNKMYQKRPYYLNKIIPFIGVDLIKVLIGQRRIGKSYILLQLMDLIKNKDNKANIIYINKEENEYDFIVDYRDLIIYAEKRAVKGVKNYLFVDEIQDIENFEKALRHLFAKKTFDIYCTGSNARLLSSEIATGLSGRYIEISIHTLSYSEFLQFHKLKTGEDSLLKYIRYGGLPFLSNLEMTDEIVYSYLQSIYNTIILKDVVARFKIRNINFLNRLLEYLADNIGSLVSANRISDFLKSQKIKTTPNIALNYLSYLSSSFIIHEVNRVNIRGKKIFEINEKYYWEDLGLRNSLVGYKIAEIGQMLENLVFLHLSRLGFKIYIGQIEGKEIDFVAEKDGRKIYVQVAYLIGDKATRDREFGNLLAISDNYPKIVVSMDKLAGSDYQGVQHRQIIDFLQDDKLLQ